MVTKIHPSSPGHAPVALITGAAHRIGAATARALHAAGWRIVIHYYRSKLPAEQLAGRLNAERQNSAVALPLDLKITSELQALVASAHDCWGRLDALVNNASTFYATPLHEINECVWEDLIGTNLKAPLFLAKAAAPLLSRSGGSIINLMDVHALRPLGNHCLYESAKAALGMLTKALAVDLAPNIRVNGVAPGNVLWSSEHPHSEALQNDLIKRVPLGRMGTVEEIASTIRFLLSSDATYISGQIIAVDGAYLCK